MPTENRSSNTEMVSVPEGYMLVERSIWTEKQCDAAAACITRLKAVPGMTDRDLAMAAVDAAQCTAPAIELSDLLPAEQHQGEPVALGIPDECPHLIVFDDAAVGQILFAGSGARSAALKKWESISVSWNAHLFVRVARNSRDDGHPCATVADPAEAERLHKGHIKALEALNEQSEKQRDHWMDECKALRSQLQLMTGDYRTAIVNGHERITFLGGDCDSVDKMLADNPNYANARALLSRKP